MGPEMEAEGLQGHISHREVHWLLKKLASEERMQERRSLVEEHLNLLDLIELNLHLVYPGSNGLKALFHFKNLPLLHKLCDIFSPAQMLDPLFKNLHFNF